VFGRDEAYLGVMLDDLVTRGVTEPYRMFTSRAEFRLTLRADNADQRLTDIGMSLGLVGEERAGAWQARKSALAAARAWADSVVLTPPEAARLGLQVNQDGRSRSVFELLAYPTIAAADLVGIGGSAGRFDARILNQLEIDAKYAVYVERQRADVAAFRRDEGLEIPADFDFDSVPGFSNESRAKFRSIRPRTVGQAQRIDGVTPAAITLLLASLRKHGPRRLSSAG